MNNGLDFSYLQSVSNGDKAFELSMIQSLITEIDQKLESTRACLAAADPAGVKLHTHSLKNMFAILGAETLRHSFLSMETLSVTAPMRLLSAKLAHCEKEWQEKKETLATVVATYQEQLPA